MEQVHVYAYVCVFITAGLIAVVAQNGDSRREHICS